VCSSDLAILEDKQVFRKRALENPNPDLLVPPTFWFEVTNGLWAAVRRGRLERGTAVAGLEGLLGFRFETWSPHPGDCLALALDHGIAAYDAAYLQVALESSSVLWTIDGQLRAAAARAGVSVEPLLPDHAG